ncbi:hypothetical protein BV25DRAFT_1816528, partial [Artomyces pyxidatus]
MSQSSKGWSAKAFIVTGGLGTSELDRDIGEAERYLAFLHRIRNRQLPALRVPSEILEYIFSFCQCHPEQPHRDRRHPPAWVVVTHVCHLWRDVALSSPRLWRNVVTYSQPWMEETLSRSKEVPL